MNSLWLINSREPKERMISSNIWKLVSQRDRDQVDFFKNRKKHLKILKKDNEYIII